MICMWLEHENYFTFSLGNKLCYENCDPVFISHDFMMAIEVIPKIWVTVLQQYLPCVTVTGEPILWMICVRWNKAICLYFTDETLYCRNIPSFSKLYSIALFVTYTFYIKYIVLNKQVVNYYPCNEMTYTLSQKREKSIWLHSTTHWIRFV